MSELWSRAALEAHSVDMRQFVGFRTSQLANGMRVIDAYNTSGLRYTLLPDRGLDIWAADFRGTPLTWIAQNAPYPPDFGQTWLMQFGGGLLTTCGLTHVGPPERDEQSGELRDLHGLYSRLRASEPSISAGWEGGDYVVRLRASVAEGWLHGYQLRLDRTYELSLTSPEIRVHDVVTNLTDKPVPFMILYHFNMGYPTVQAGTRLAATGNAYSRDAEAAKSAGQWADYRAAERGYVEQVYFHHLHAEQGQTEVALINGDAFALGFRWQTAHLPYLTQWKNMRHGMYVHGVEPGNCIPEGRNSAGKTGRLVSIQPDERIDFGQISLSVYSEAADVHALRERLSTLQKSGEPVAGCTLSDYNPVD